MNALLGIFVGLISFLILFIGSIFAAWTSPLVLVISYLVSGLPFLLFARRAHWRFAFIGAAFEAVLVYVLFSPRFGLTASLVAFVFYLIGRFSLRFYDPSSISPHKND
jgi:hypothetical protein